MSTDAVLTIFGILSLLGFAVIVGRICRSIWRWTFDRGPAPRR
jgi:hypothetical protein